MSDCCSNTCSSTSTPKKYKCPVNGQEYKQVSYKTILHHIKEPWQWEGADQTYYFCDDPDCDVVYFGEDNSTVTCDSLRTSVGVKEKSDKATICYCFGVSINDALKDTRIKEYVTDKTKDHVCDCEIRNPSGKCCLKDFPKS